MAVAAHASTQNSEAHLTKQTQQVAKTFSSFSTTHLINRSLPTGQQVNKQN